METQEETRQESAAPPEEELGEPTAPPFTVQVQGLDEEPARLLGNKVHGYITVLSTYIDLERLDGVTVAVDYSAALAQLDRGFEATLPLSATDDGIVIGAAMTPGVMRDGVVKSHIVINANVIWPLVAVENDKAKDDSHRQALYLLAHECGHVEVFKLNDLAMPDILLKKSFGTIDETVRWQTIMPCWDEYAASRLSASFGIQWPYYEETFVKSLQQTWGRANDFIRAYRLHGNLEQVIGEVTNAYGNLIKYASYLLGDLHGHGLDTSVLKAAQPELADDWFGPYFERLEKAMADAWEHRGGPGFRERAELIGTIAARGRWHVLREAGRRDHLRRHPVHVLQHAARINIRPASLAALPPARCESS